MSGTSQPEVSVLITSFNYGRYIGRAIQSALDQNVPGLEVVVVDDRSTDNSWEIINDLCARDSRLRAVRNETNLGMNRNVQRSLELARAARVAFLAADDYLLPGHLARLLAIHREHPEVDVVYTPYFRVDDADRVIDHIGHIGHLRGPYFGGRNEFAGLLTYDCYTSMPTSLFDRDTFTEVRLDDTLVANDYDLYLRLAQSGKVFGFLDVAGVCFRMHGEGASAESKYMATGKQLTEQLSILERFLTADNYHLIRGHERGIARLLQAKVNNLQINPPVAATVLPQLQPRIDAIVERLNGFIASTAAATIAPNARISVILPCQDDINAVVSTIANVREQTHDNVELVLVADSSFATMPFLLDAARGLIVKHLAHSVPRGLGAALNDGVRLAGGEIITYAQPGRVWQNDYLAHIAKRFSQENTNAIIVPQATAATSPPSLYSLAHTQTFLDLAGHFNEALAQGADADFMSRIVAA